MRASRFEIEPEITAQVLRRGFRIGELPIGYNPRSRNEGKKISWRDGFGAIACFSHQLHVPRAVDELAQPVAHDGVVVRDEDSNHDGSSSVGAASGKLTDNTALTTFISNTYADSQPSSTASPTPTPTP